MLCKATQDRQVIVQSSDKTWSPRGGNGSPLQHSCLENPADSVKRQKGMTAVDEPPDQVSGMPLGKYVNRSVVSSSLGPHGL